MLAELGLSNFGIPEVGHFFLAISWVFILYSTVGGAFYGITGKSAGVNSPRNSLILSAVSLIASILFLGISFVNTDFSLQYVWQLSNKSMPIIYRITAIWGGMDGSMLLWCVILGINSLILAISMKKYQKRFQSWLTCVASSSLLFFTTITLFFTNPFRYLNIAVLPLRGNGLNPLLQNPYMAIHPPMLYLGFTTFAIPCAFCVAALLTKRFLGKEEEFEYASWSMLARKWTLVSWCFLTVGIVLGGHWAYLELGWGGFWAWDPVENASFLPWLTGTAFLHSVMVEQRLGMLKTWNVWLIVLTYTLTVFGTFLTRSGIVQSVHSFASSDIGWVFLLYIALILITTIVLTQISKKILKPQNYFKSFLSREVAFLVNNLLLLSICFAVLWGVMFPVFSEAISGHKQSVGIPFFNKITIPLFLALIFTMGVGQLIGWKQSSWSSLRKMFVLPTIFSFIVGLILIWAGITSFYPVLSYVLCCFVVVSLMVEVRRGYKAIKSGVSDKSAVSVTKKLVKRNRVRYGGYIVHIGVIIAVIGITASMAHKVEREFALGIGESVNVGRFNLTLDNVAEKSAQNYMALQAKVKVKDKNTNESIAKLVPELRRYPRNGESTTEVALRMGLKEDLYLVLAGLDNSGRRATFKIFINPLQVWLWFGVIIMVFGTLIVLPNYKYKEI